ncbi:MAG TPA: SMC-Scp complex subunit ScpB [Polyangia bacterium]|jgi:segregation and condensation protein B|nr:SMC-Scp complex subunit ScpB [Polyangia bacterium]
MKKRKKKGDATTGATGATSGAADAAGEAADALTPGPDSGAVVQVIDASEEPTQVNDAPVPEEARGPEVASDDPLDVAIDVHLEGPAETTQQSPTEVVMPPIDAPDAWDGPTAVAGLDEVAALVARSARPELGEGHAGDEAGTPVGQIGEATAEATAENESPPVESTSRLEMIIESLIFASDKPLGLNELKRLVDERDAKKLSAALETLKARHQDTGIQLLGVAGGWQFRTNPENSPWVGKLLSGKPARLSRAMLETLSIVAYRQPITRPEIDEIRGVDCGPVLKTLLDRGMVRMIGKKEDVGRPILYGTTPEFLRTFSLRDLTELPTLREFHELGVAEMAKVDAEAPRPSGAGASGGAGDAAAAPAAAPTAMPPPTELTAADPDEEDALLSELEEATSAASKASKARESGDAPPSDESAGIESAAPAAASETPEG